MKGYLVTPKSVSGPIGSVIVIHENRGLNDHIRDVARRVALAGFRALAVDFLSPQGGTPSDEDKAREMFSGLDMDATVANAEAGRVWLAARQGANGKVGAVGFCWGGGLVNRFATKSAGLNAGVAYYGQQPPAADVPAIKAPLLLQYAGLDERINAGIDAYKRRWRKTARPSKSSFMTASTTPSTTIRPRRDTTRPRPISPGAGQRSSSKISGVMGFWSAVTDNP